MQVIVDLFNLILLAPIINLLVLVYRTLQSAQIPGALGLSIILLTVLIRFLVWPFMSTQLKSAQKMAELKPKLDVLKKKHKDNKQLLAQAQMALYKEHGINPAGGCLPALLQIPVVIALYQAISILFEGNGLERINHFLYSSTWHLSSAPDPFFFGFNLASRPSDFGSAGAVVLAVPVITGLLQFIQSKMMVPRTIKDYPTDSPKEKAEKEQTEDAIQAMQGQMVFLMPLMIGYFAFTFPIGVSLYWNIFTLMGIWQQYLLSGWGSLAEWLEKVPLKKS